MTLSDIRIGTRLELLPINRSGEFPEPPMVSCLEAVERDGGLVVLAPIVEDRVFPFHPDDTLAIVFERNGERYGFRAMVRDRYREGEIRFLYLWPETETESVQRRGFYRLSHVADCLWRPEPSPRVPETARAPWHSTLTRNIGGGGVGLLFEDKPEMGINIEGILETEEKIGFQARIVRSIPTNPESTYRYEAGVAFTWISNRDRERLIRLIYEIQRKQLSKGWSGV